MRFTEHELTIAVTSAAKQVAAGKRRRDPEQTWEKLTRYQRYQVIDAVGQQVLPVLLALPDREVAAGERPTFSNTEVLRAVEECLGDAGGWLRRKATVATRLALVNTGLAALPARQD